MAKVTSEPGAPRKRSVKAARKRAGTLHADPSRPDPVPPDPPRPDPPRRARGFLRASELTTAALKSTGARRGFAEARLLTEWRAVVGEALDRVCRPVKVSYGARSIGLGATLVVTAEGARAPEVEMQKMRIIERVNAFYGYRAVSRLTIDQSRSRIAAPAPHSGMAEAATPFDGPAPAALGSAISEVKDEALALALSRLGANISAKMSAASPETGSGAPDEHDNNRRHK